MLLELSELHTPPEGVGGVRPCRALGAENQGFYPGDSGICNR